jgi:hypothetical protein
MAKINFPLSGGCVRLRITQAGTSKEPRRPWGALADGRWLDATLVNSAVLRESMQLLGNGRLERARHVPSTTTLLNSLRKVKAQ